MTLSDGWHYFKHLPLVMYSTPPRWEIHKHRGPPVTFALHEQDSPDVRPIAVADDYASLQVIAERLDG